MMWLFWSFFLCFFLCNPKNCTTTSDPGRVELCWVSIEFGAPPVLVFQAPKGHSGATPKPKVGGQYLVTCPWLLIQYIWNYPPNLEAVFSLCNLKTSHAMVTFTQNILVQTVRCTGQKSNICTGLVISD
jgi:hypothetical protein